MAPPTHPARRTSKAALFALCWLVYATAYLARAGISAGFPTLAAHYGTDAAWLGTVGGAFFVAYALGQLVNGYLGDRVPPTRFVLGSMAGSACVYALTLLTDDAALLPWLWGLNGVFLSMLWGPMLRLLCMRLGRARKEGLAMLLGAAPVGGYCLAWLALAPRYPALGWRAVYLIPLLLTALQALPWALLARGGNACGGDRCDSEGWSAKRHSVPDTLRYIRAHRLWPLALTSLCLGLVKENLALLLPALFVGFLHVAVQDAAWLLLLSPLANLLGLLMGRLLKRPLVARPALGLAATFGGMAAACGLLVLAPDRPGAAFAGLFLLTALAYLGSCIQISYIPLSHVDENMVSTLVGLFDFANYAGAALCSAALGALLGGGHMAATALVWLGVCLLAAALAWGQARRDAQATHEARSIGDAHGA